MIFHGKKQFQVPQTWWIQAAVHQDSHDGGQRQRMGQRAIGRIQ
jgi:hypothetical protein